MYLPAKRILRHVYRKGIGVDLVKSVPTKHIKCQEHALGSDKIKAM